MHDAAIKKQNQLYMMSMRFARNILNRITVQHLAIRDGRGAFCDIFAIFVVDVGGATVNWELNCFFSQRAKLLKILE